MFDIFASRKYSFEQIPDLTGKIAIITGSNTGIGKVCAFEMAKKNCTVILACRNKEKSEAVVEQIKSETGNQNVDFIQINLLKLASIKAFVDAFLSRYQQLDILINNAGVMMPPFGLSEDGIEQQFATNHVAHHLLTLLLLPTLQQSSDARIVNVSSMGHRIPFRRLDLHSISDPKKYNRIVHYAKSKACNILFTRELARRLEAQGIQNVFVNTNHPGAVSTELYRYTPSFATYILRSLVLITPEDGALTQLYLATSPEIKEKQIRGQFYVPYGVPSQPGGVAASADAPLELWEFTEALIKEKVASYEGAPI
ncbi:hypothetical protein BDF20DRAFT_818893 [Mycotypha africana]|uniref:uncharacterized protein n=1 Tax=Mycotypha africana TaxID=64632 RepID=UPI0023003A94|nr:uncharacterized protein BDF20DRAFT_818893 [Mycotypha africana]KAI8979144.1 hypothetical protein BDF20DRAFT_818893 [Mycotypha africana]